MAKSPEEYLSSLSFDMEPPSRKNSGLDAGERAFVEKYLGLDAFAEPEGKDPLLAPLPVQEKAPPPPVKVKEPEIVIAPAKQLEKEALKNAAAEKSPIQIIVAQKEALKQPDLAGPKTMASQQIKTAEPMKAASIVQTAQVKPVKAPQKVQEIAKAPDLAANAEVKQQLAAQAGQAKTEASKITVRPAPVFAEMALREKLRLAAEVHVVSFYVSEQLFLLPVEGIQEVVRHLELIKVPQAPAFIAGAINLRGSVLPLVRLSALLTNDPPAPYNNKNFIIIAGADQLRVGLIIDRVNSMHMIPQKKIIWNAESKLGEAAEFLSAIVDLDDHVCGMISTDLITQKILPDLFTVQQDNFKA